MSTSPTVGQPLDRVDGRLKVTGAAAYAYEARPTRAPAYGFILPATIAKGRIAAIDARQRHAGPEGDRLRLQDVADVDGALEEADAPGPAFRLRRQQRRLVLAARVEQEARPCLDDAAEPPRAELARQRLGPPHPAFRQRVEMLEVERQRHAVVAGLGDQRDGIAEPVVGRAIGVVGEAQRHAQAACRWR